MEVDFSQIAFDIKNQAYKCIGAGTGRLVFDFGNGCVIKVARNTRGIAQNKAECKISSVADSSLLARVLNVSEDFRFLIMEKADNIEDISYVWNFFNVRNNDEFNQIQELKDICSKYNLLFWDLGRPVNWGKINGKPVVIDYGYTENVESQFY